MVIAERVEQLQPWYHSISMPDGTVTPGKIETAQKFKLFASTLPDDLSGYTVLDLGCSSGGLALEYAKKGARVTGIDSKKLEVDQASFVFESYGFQGVFHQDDVMNAWKYGQFDIVNACGLLYHLPYPMLFLDLISLICRKHLILSTRISPEMNGSMELMRQETHGNWWFPTEECVGRMTMLAGFTDLVILSVNGDRSNLFCSARGRTNLRELSETENAFEYLIESRSPSGRRIIGASARNDFPES